MQQSQRLRNIHVEERLSAKNPAGRRFSTDEEHGAWQERVAARREFQDLIKERNAYRLQSKGRTKNGEGTRYECPIHEGRLDVESHPPVHLREKCCTTRITIPNDVLGKHRQKHIWGTRAWFDSYARRTTVERSFGNLKGDEGMLRKGWTRQVGLVKLSFAAAMTIMAHNLETLLRWAKLHSPHASFITSIQINTVEVHDPDPGVDPTTIPEYLRPA